MSPLTNYLPLSRKEIYLGSIAIGVGFDRCVDDLDQILHFETPVGGDAFRRIPEHVVVLGTGDHKIFQRRNLQRLSYALHARPLRLPRIGHPDAPAAGAAAETVCTGPVHLGQPQAERAQDRARRIGDLRVPGEMTRIVVCHGRIQALFQRQSPGPDRLPDDLGIVAHRVGSAELRAFELDGIVRVGIGRDDLFEPGPGESRGVLLRQQLIQSLLADAANVVARVALSLVQDPEVEPRGVQYPGRGARDRLQARFVGRVIYYEPENLDRLLARILDAK